MPVQLVGAIKEASAPGASANPFTSLRGRLIVVTTVLVITASLMAAGLLLDAAIRHRASTEQQLSETTRALSLAVDGEILQRQAVLRTLAASPALQSGDFKDFERQARASPSGGGSGILLLDSKGSLLVDTVPHPAAPQPAGGRALFAQIWPELLKANEHISGLTLLQGRYIFHLDYVVSVGGQPAYDLVMAMPTDILQGLLARQDLPSGWSGGIVNADGILLARNRDPQRWVGSSAGGELLHHLQGAPAGVYESFAKDGAPILAAYSRSPVTGWTVGVGVPRYQATGELVRSLQWLSFVGAVLLLLGGGLTLWFVRDVARAVHGLERFAESLGRGEAVGAPQPTGLRETDFIGAALGAAAERLLARELELERINETLEARVREASAQLVQSQKVEAIGRLTGGVAHDFNNLLTAVIGNLELLRRKLTDERLIQFVHNAKSAADRGAKLTAQLLAFARKQTLTREPINVNAMIVGMEELLASSLNRDCSIETDLDPELPLATADRTQLEMVLLNLVLNARDALLDRGVIEISTGREHVMHPSPRAEHPPPGDFVRITVADNGIGMTPEVMEQVFEPFFTTKPPGRGSGLGLSQALGVAQQLGGGLRIDSCPGRGARVHVYLPVAVVQPLAVAKEPSRPRRRAPAR
jgi:signal transduction histidine kinase